MMTTWFSVMAREMSSRRWLTGRSGGKEITRGASGIGCQCYGATGHLAAARRELAPGGRKREYD
jgi:hypothetical protein